MSKEENDNKKDTPEEGGQRKESQGRPGPIQPLKFFRGGVGWLVALGVGLLVVVLVTSSYDTATEITLDQFYSHLANANIAEVIIDEGSLRGTLRSVSGQTKRGTNEFKVSFPTTAQDYRFIQDMVAKCSASGAKLRQDKTQNILLELFFSPLLIWLIIVVFIWFMFFRQLRNSAGGAGMLGSFGRSRHRMMTKEHVNVTFDDVAGSQEAKEDVAEVVEFLKNPGKFQRLGGRIPRGILLVGEPGCGKTLLAKAVAGEADVPFFSISGSDFVEMFVGVGASRVRDLFSQAKTSSPCIIFLDEIDAVGRRRGGGVNGGGHDEREQTLNAILVEMDGFESSDQVIVIAATNRADVLDPALTRPGRFDRQVYVPLPDVKGRFEILEVHAKNIKLSESADLLQLAKGTQMMSGADLAAIVNEAAIIATLAGKESVETEDLEEARDRIRWGRAKRSRVVEEYDRKTTAFHEAGHALVAEMIEAADPVHKVSVIPRGQAAGMTMMLPEADRQFYSYKYLLAELRVLLAGRVAEEMACGEISSGAADDIKRATQMARMMVCEWGMSDRVGLVKVGADRNGSWPAELGGREYSEQTAETVDSEIQRLTKDAYDDASKMITENRDKLDRLAEALIKYETLEAEDVKRVMRGETIDKPTVAGLLDDVVGNNVDVSAGDEDEKSVGDAD